MSEIKVTTNDNELSLQEMSEALPDTATIMTRVGECWWRLIYAARGGNWGLAGYYMRRMVKLENTLVVLRPKHKERMARFQEVAVPPVVAAIEERDLSKLEDAYTAATDLANELHAESGYPYVQWELPDEAPKGLQLGPVAGVDDLSGNGQRQDMGSLADGGMMIDLGAKLPALLRALPMTDSAMPAYRLAADGCDVLIVPAAAGAEIPRHDHVTDNSTVIVSGEVIVTTDEGERRYRPGEWYQTRPGQMHAVKVEVDTVMVELRFAASNEPDAHRNNSTAQQ